MADPLPVLPLRAENASDWTGPEGNTTYLIRGAVPTLIDAGVGHPAHVAAIARALQGRHLAAILITHAHPDHAGGIPALASRWPRARIRNVHGDVCRDGEVLPAGDGALRVLHTPGHAPDHMCFFDETTRDLFCGDLAREGGTIVIPATSGGDLAGYLQSLRRVRALAPGRLLPGHGPVVEDPATLLDRYIQHRDLRERQIIEALRSGCTTELLIVGRVYGTLAPALTAAAAETVLAHLKKLETEGRAVGAGGVWRLTSGGAG